MGESQRTPEQRRKASEHLHYEVTMLDATAQRLAAGVPDGVTKDGLLEAFAVHARALLHFFWPEGKVADDDVQCADYFNGAPLPGLPNEPPAALHGVRRRVGKEVVHLTYQRLEVGPEAKRWNVTAIHTALMRAVEAFARQAPVALLAPCWTPPPHVLVLPATATSTTDQPQTITYANTIAPAPGYVAPPRTPRE